MIYTIKNNELTVKISDKGAEITSVIKDGCEYMWQGNPAYWDGQAPVLFPICGRFFKAKYTHECKEYQMGTHGFARHCVFDAKQSSNESVTFVLTQNDFSLEQYPFDFCLSITYTLTGNKLTSTTNILNTGKVIMPATFGAHPAFNVPLDMGSFEDWYVEFGEDCTPNELIFSDTCFNTGKKRAYPIKDSRIIPLRHSLFDIDAIFLSRVASSATLKCAQSSRSVTLEYRDMPYLGLWHKPRTDAPYVCIEPWCGLPSFDGEVDELTSKCDMFHIESGKDVTLEYSMIFN